MAYDQTKPEEKSERLLFDDEDFLAIARAELSNSLGMESGDTLQSDRELALEYYKGNMFDQPTAPDRSRAVQTVVADMIGQAMPDLVEIFLGGEEIGAFRAVGEEDEEAAKQETEVVNNVIQSENDGFGLIHDYVHDALLMKAGVFHAYTERSEAYEERTLENQTSMALQELAARQQAGGLEVLEVKQTGHDPMIGDLYSVEIGEKRTNVKICVESVPPEDFAVGRDTADLRDATYAVMRRRPRVQALKALGYDAALIERLPTWSQASDQALETARDTAGEHAQPSASSQAHADLRQVLIYVHAIRVDADGDGDLECWRLITDESCSILLDKQKLDRMPFAMGTPYRQPHRAYGRSLADLSIELQRIMTALLRLHLDGGYFAINARHEIDETRATEHTIADYLNNTPGYPVRSKGNALHPLVSSKSDFNALESLEYMATVGETRTGITRNAQGLNPDTLHDTAKGAQALMTNAQKRLRLIARTLAETGIRDLFLLVHALLRTSGMDRPMAMRLRNRWVQVDPTRWGERKDFRIEIGMGAGGREMDLQAGMVISNLLDKIVGAQAEGAIAPPIVTSKNVFSFADWLRERAGVKRTTFFTDPESPEGQQLAAQKQEAPPDPAVVKAQMAMQAKQQEMQLSMQMKQAEMEMADRHQQAQYEKDLQLAEAQQRDDMARAATDAEDRARKHELELFKAQRAADEAERKYELDMEKLRIEQQKLDLDRQKMDAEAAQSAAEMEMRAREMEHSANVEAMKLDDAKEARAIDLADRQQDRATRAVEKPAPKEVSQDRSHEALGKGLEAVGEGLKALSKPKRIKRGKDGKVEGIE